MVCISIASSSSPSDGAFKVVEYLAYNLLYNYANTTDVKSYVDKYDFYIFPIVNPDGMNYYFTMAIGSQNLS